MATELLAVGTTAANSGDLTVAAGETVLVALKDAAGPVPAQGAVVDISLKDDDGEYFVIGKLSPGTPALVLAAPGTFRFSRRAGVSCGVFSA